MSSSDSNKLKDKKFGARHLIIALLVLFVGLPLLITTITGSGNNEANPAPKSQKKEEVRPVSYEIVWKKDVSMMYGGEKAKRMKYQVVVGKNIERRQLRPTAEKIVSDLTGANNEIDSIHLLLYSTESRTNGPYDIAMADWAPGGEVGNLTGKIARENIRDNYEIKINIRKDNLEEYLEKISQEGKTKFGLTQKERKQVFGELVKCEDKAIVKAEKHYASFCSDCPEFIEQNMEKSTEMEDRLIKKCEKGVREKYEITEEQQSEIKTEAFEKSWPTPELPPEPDCCGI